MRIREVKDETIVVGPTEPPEAEKMPSLGSEGEGAEECERRVGERERLNRRQGPAIVPKRN